MRYYQLEDKVLSNQPIRALIEEDLQLPLCSLPDNRITVGDLLNHLSMKGITCYVSGGAPRDWVQGKRSLDIDLAVGERMSIVRELLLEDFSKKDFTMFIDDSFGLLAWGEKFPYHVDINVLRDYREFGQPTFKPQTVIDYDYQTRDFTINSLYYSYNEKLIIDPTGKGIEDISRNRLRMVADEIVFKHCPRTTYRIAKFLMKGYEPSPCVLDYLQQYMARDMEGISDVHYLDFLRYHVQAKGSSIPEFIGTLRKLARDAGCHKQAEDRIRIGTVEFPM